MVTSPLARRILALRSRFRPKPVTDFPKWFRGSYSSWQEAVSSATGYGDPVILERVLASARLVRDGHASFERDSVAFYHKAFNWPVLAALFFAAARRDGYLHVLDFGGSLGTLYFQHREALSGVPAVRWGVVEQPTVVHAGKAEFEDGVLSFHATIPEAAASLAPNVVIGSSVLPYLESPAETLLKLAAATSDLLILDRTSVVESGPSALVVQVVPPSIYLASYPCWFFDWDQLIAPLASSFRQFATFESSTEGRIRLPSDQTGLWRGCTFLRSEGARDR